jgi:L-alanine-DL-glutamate epimerase-like enolase superfamily enzyme
VKITGIAIHIIDLEREYHFPAHGSFRAEAGLLRIFTDEGIEGNADFCTWAVPSVTLATSILALKSRLLGKDPFHVEQLWNETYSATRSAISIYAPGCINVALWDIMGKALGVPLYRLLGGSRDRVRAYASTQSCKDVDAFVDLAQSLVGRGFTAIKLHPWSDPARDIALCRAVRKAVGDTTDLMIDPMGLYSRGDALRVGRVLDELNFCWYEEPISEADVEGYIELCRCLDIPVVGVDSLRLSLGNYADYIARGAFDIVQADAARQGITWCRKAAALAEAFGRRFQVHSYGPPLHQAANLHLLAGLHETNGLFEMPVPEGILDTAVTGTITLEADGCVTVPQGPGLGLETDRDLIDKHTVALFQ